jgi:ribosomal protein S7
MNLSQKLLYSGFINFFILKGKKTLSKKIVDQTFFLISKKVKAPSFLIFFLFLTKLNILVEARKVENRKKSFFVPFPVNSKRRIFLALS